ncbi:MULTISPECIES: alpha/beta hydrolase [Burkholderiaceae]|uniref:alpha/beta fold hydrolase n=1 Tax=Burkholderiaceae TaxID=119060 RepID=UPI0014223AAD|nr:MULTISPECIES: alpha/beta hydrolase [Burkholderiaceae]MBN3848863.1 alpha/beta hydrolase [Paraburkholderia sp. Ac-20342]NIF50940.1 alpha/beta hydrolase [Burkholderia sp. Ax-1724]
MSTASQNTRSDNLKDLLGSGDHTVNLNGVDLHYRVCGEGPLLFLISPGWGVGSGYLQRGFNFLRERFRLVFIDTRGSGQSGRPADRMKMSSNDMADDLEALREYLGLSTLQLLGHSNSGAIALSYAERYKNHVSKLVLIDSQMLGFSSGNDTQAFLEARAEDPRYKTAVQAAIGHFSGKAKPLASDAELSAFVAELLPLYLQSPEKNLALAREQLLVEQISLYAFEAQNAADKEAGSDQTALLDQVRAPTLVMVGRHDWICPVPVAERLHAGIGNARLVMFEESGHMPWIEEPEKFAAELIQFLEE